MSGEKNHELAFMGVITQKTITDRIETFELSPSSVGGGCFLPPVTVHHHKKRQKRFLIHTSVGAKQTTQTVFVHEFPFCRGGFFRFRLCDLLRYSLPLYTVLFVLAFLLNVNWDVIYALKNNVIA
jgi:hypothetical protein